MRTITAWILIAILGAVMLSAGCEQQETQVEEAPPQTPIEKFPESAVPPPEPQPVAAATLPPAPPVDTAADKPVAAASKSQVQQQPKESYATGQKKAARTHVVKKGDTLQKISKKYYGTTKNWRRICDANKNVLKDCDVLIPGTKLVIP